MRVLRLGFVAAALCAAFSCSRLPPPQSSWDREVNFASLKTFGWYADPAEDKGVGSAIVDTRYVQDHVMKDTTAALEKKGYRRAGDDTADFFMDYHTRAAGIVTRDKYGAYGWWAMPVYMGSQVEREAILALDVRDRDKKLIWRGWVTKTVGTSPEAIGRNIKKAVDQLMALFPPTAEAPPKS